MSDTWIDIRSESNWSSPQNNWMVGGFSGSVVLTNAQLYTRSSTSNTIGIPWMPTEENLTPPITLKFNEQDLINPPEEKKNVIVIPKRSRKISLEE